MKTAHGVLPVPAPATIRLLEGFNVRHGPPGSGELTTPTGAALLRVLSKGAPPQEYSPRHSGYGAGTRDIHGQLNALRIILGEATVDHHDHHHHHHREHVHTEHLHVLSADIDDMSPEELAGAADVLRAEGALDVVLLHTTMKKGRLGTRVEALVQTSDLARLEEKIFLQFTTLGVKTFDVVRNALERESRLVRFDGRDIRVKVATLPDGTQRAKPEFDDLRRVAEETSRPLAEIRSEVMSALNEADLASLGARKISWISRRDSSPQFARPLGDRVAYVCYSGGIDSTVVLAASVRAGIDTVALLGVSPSLAASERADAHRIASEIGARVEEVETNEMELAGYRANAGDRCYYCKSALVRHRSGTRRDEKFGRGDLRRNARR